MSLKLSKASYTDIDEIVKVFYSAYSNPHDPFVDLWPPGLAENSSVRRVRGEKQTAIDWLLSWSTSSNQHWIKVVDSDSGKIVSVSNWVIHYDNTYEAPDIADAEWFPKGSLIREYAKFLEDTRTAQGLHYRQSPHIYLEFCVTLPNYRCRGAAGLMLQWGVQEAEKSGLKIVVEATVEGKQLYKRFGFVTKEITRVINSDRQEDDEWLELQERYPLMCCWMERPAPTRNS